MVSTLSKMCVGVLKKGKEGLSCGNGDLFVERRGGSLVLGRYSSARGRGSVCRGSRVFLKCSSGVFCDPGVIMCLDLRNLLLEGVFMKGPPSAKSVCIYAGIQFSKAPGGSLGDLVAKTALCHIL